MPDAPTRARPSRLPPGTASSITQMAASVMFMKENMKTVQDILLRAQKPFLPSIIMITPQRALPSARAARTATRTPSPPPAAIIGARSLARRSSPPPSAADADEAAALRLTLLQRRRRRRCHFFKVCRGDRSAISHGGAGAR